MAWATSVGPQRGTAVSRCELNHGRHGMTTPSDWCLPACLLRTSPASCLLPFAFCLLPLSAWSRLADPAGIGTGEKS